jgi:hypothetical protein
VHTGQAVLAAAVIIPLVLALLGVLRHARGTAGKPKARAGGASGWLAHRRALRLENTRHYNGMLRDAARHWHRMREHEARQQAGRTAGADPGAPGDPAPGNPGSGPSPQEPPPPRWRATVIHVWSRWHPAGDETYRRAPDPAALDTPVPHPGSRNETPGPRRPGRPSPASELPERAGDASPVVSRPALDPIPTVEGTIVTTPAQTVPGVEQVIEGLRAIYQHAVHGNIQAKRRGILALVHVARSAAATAISLSRTMGEQRHYGIEVTERVSAMAMHFTAAGSAGEEADSMLGVLLRSSVEESMAVGRQMPHHEELQESGAY